MRYAKGRTKPWNDNVVRERESSRGSRGRGGRDREDDPCDRGGQIKGEDVKTGRRRSERERLERRHPTVIQRIN